MNNKYKIPYSSRFMHAIMMSRVAYIDISCILDFCRDSYSQFQLTEKVLLQIVYDIIVFWSDNGHSFNLLSLSITYDNCIMIIIVNYPLYQLLNYKYTLVLISTSLTLSAVCPNSLFWPISVQWWITSCWMLELFCTTNFFDYWVLEYAHFVKFP